MPIINTNKFHQASRFLTNQKASRLLKQLRITPNYYRDDDSHSTFGTWWYYNQVWFSAAHVFEECNHTLPDFIKIRKHVEYRPGALDAIMVSPSKDHLKRMAERMRDTQVGEPIVVAGNPAYCSRRYEVRTGTASHYRDADPNPDAIVMADTQRIMTLGENILPVGGGMSGGPVLTKSSDRRWFNKWSPQGILIIQNGTYDHDMNPATPVRESADVLDLKKVLEHVE